LLLANPTTMAALRGDPEAPSRKIL